MEFGIFGWCFVNSDVRELGDLLVDLPGGFDFIFCKQLSSWWAVHFCQYSDIIHKHIISP